MQNSPGTKTIAALAGAILLIGVAIHFIGRSPATPRAEPIPPRSVVREEAASPPPSAPPLTDRIPRVKKPVTPAAIEETEDDPTGQRRLPRAKVEEYLTVHGRDAASLLAAFHTLDDTNYLREAAVAHATDPMVQWTVLARDVFPEDRRRWLDAFKTSSPSNSLADYLSARDYLNSGNTNAAIADLFTATRKGQFKDYANDVRSGEEQLRLFGGQTPDEAISANGWAQDLLPELSSFKSLAQMTGTLHNQYRDAGDAASASQIAGVGLVMAGRLNAGDDSSFLIGQLVGIAMEGIVLNNLDQNTPSDLLGGKTPAQRTAELKQYRADLKQLTGSLQTTLMSMPPDDRLEYSQRMSRDGEINAIRWLQQRQQPASK